MEPAYRPTKSEINRIPYMAWVGLYCLALQYERHILLHSFRSSTSMIRTCMCIFRSFVFLYAFSLAYVCTCPRNTAVTGLLSMWKSSVYSHYTNIRYNILPGTVLILRILRSINIGGQGDAEPSWNHMEATTSRRPHSVLLA